MARANNAHIGLFCVMENAEKFQISVKNGTNILLNAQNAMADTS